MKKSQPKKKKKREKEINGEVVEVVGYGHRSREMGEEIKSRGYDLF